MKQKFIAVTKTLLTTCMALSWWVGTDWASILLIGEYPYPARDAEEK